MSKLSDNDIPVLTVTSQDEDAQRGMFPSPTRMAAKLSNVPTGVLEENLAGIVKRLGKIVDELPELPKGCRVDTVTFSLAVNAAGKLALIGELSAGMTSGITITLKRQ